MASKQVASLPESLLKFIEKQPIYRPSQYAIWRYIRKVGHPFLSE